MPSDFRYAANFLAVHSPPPSVRNCFTCLPDSISLKAFHSFNFTRAFDLYSSMYSSVCLVASSMKSSIFQPPPMAVSSVPHMSECMRYRGLVGQEVVFGVKGFLLNLHLIQLLQSHLPVILGASVIEGKISKSLRLMCVRQRCHNILFSALCQDAFRVVLSTSRPLLLSLAVYSFYSGARSRMWSRMNCPSTWSTVAINLLSQLTRMRLLWFTGFTLKSLSMIWDCETRLNDPGKCTASWSMMVSLFPSGSWQINLILPYADANDVTPLYPFNFCVFGRYSV